MNVRIDSVVSINQTRVFFMCKYMYMSSVYMYISSAIIILLMYICILYMYYMYMTMYLKCAFLLPVDGP